MKEKMQRRSHHEGFVVSSSTLDSPTSGILNKNKKPEALSPQEAEKTKEKLVKGWIDSDSQAPVEGESSDSNSSLNIVSLTEEEQSVRYHLKQKARGGHFYASERLLAMELGDEVTFQIVSNAGKLGLAELPADVEAIVSVRLLEAFYIGQGHVVAQGRNLKSYQRIMTPFGTVQEDRSFQRIQGTTVKELTDNVRCIFEQNFSGMLFCRAFGYALYRLETRKRDESILDAYCVALYAIKLLQGELDEFMNMEFGDLIETELTHYKSENVDMTADDMLWCFCVLLLRTGVHVRSVIGTSTLDSSLLECYSPLCNEEMIVVKLAMEIRPESPVSFLSSYHSIMDVKSVVPPPLRAEWMETAFSFVAEGLAEAEQWGDPCFLYTLNMILAYWMPTHTYPTKYSHQELQNRIKIANDWKEECKHEVPSSFFRFGEEHQESLQYLLALKLFDKEADSMPPLVDAFRYPTPPLSKGHSYAQVAPSSLCQTVCRECRTPCQNAVTCSRCGRAKYCSDECQVSHWESIHRHECVPKAGNSCGHCGKNLEKKLSCSKCRAIFYCNRKCQLAHWKAGHKKDCKLMKILS